MLSREIRSYTAAMFEPEHAVPPGRPAGEPDRGRGLDREPRRDALPDRPPRRAPAVLGRSARSWSTRRSTRSPTAMRAITPRRAGRAARSRPTAEPRLPALLALRERCLKLGAELPWAERGAILTLLGSAERAFYLIERIDAERRSVSRVVRRRASTRRAAPASDGLRLRRSGRMRSVGRWTLHPTRRRSWPAPPSPACRRSRRRRRRKSLGGTGVTGAGSTFAYPVVSRWAQGYQRWVAGGGDYPDRRRRARRSAERRRRSTTSRSARSPAPCGSRSAPSISAPPTCR